MEEVQKHLFELQDMAYRDFHSRLMPGIDKETIIGIRVPVLRKYAKSIAGTELAEKFIKELPHCYYEENNLHMMLGFIWMLILTLSMCGLWRKLSLMSIMST